MFLQPMHQLVYHKEHHIYFVDYHIVLDAHMGTFLISNASEILLPHQMGVSWHRNAQLSETRQVFNFLHIQPMIYLSDPYLGRLAFRCLVIGTFQHLLGLYHRMVES